MLVITIVFSSCQPTPEKNIVTSKETDLIETVLEANKEAAKSDEEISQTSNESVVPDIDESQAIVEEQIKKINGHMSMEVEPNDKVTILVDADIIVPDIEETPFVRVAPARFSADQFESFAQVLTGGKPIFYSDRGQGRTNLVKEEIEILLPVLKSYLLDETLPNYMANAINMNIEMLTNDYEKASDKLDDRPFDGTLETVDLDSSETLVELKSYLQNNVSAIIRLWQNDSNTMSEMAFDNYDYGCVFNTFEPNEGIDAERMELKYDTAKEMAYKLAHEVDGVDSNLVLVDTNTCYIIGGFANYNKENSPQAYRFLFARQYNGMEIKRMGYLTSGSAPIEYSQTVQPETLEVIIDDNGYNLASWVNYTEDLKVLAEDTPLKSFDKIQDIFEQHCSHEFAWVPHNDAFVDQPSVTLSIEKVELNLMLIPEKDNLLSYITVPVWDFVGNMKYNEDVEAQDGFPVNDIYGISIVTINAIDGSIIDRELGY